MAVDSHIVRQGQRILLGIALDNVAIDMVTTDTMLAESLRILEGPHQGLTSCQVGTFGSYAVTLNYHHDGSVSVFVDGPEFTAARNQSFGIWLGKEDIHRILTAALREKVSDG